MKITREEKQLYKLLDVVNKIFGKTDERTTICGNNNSLYFHTLGYCGVFISKDNDETLVDAYDFETYFYELKQLPNKSFVLDVIQWDVTEDTQLLYYGTLDFISNRINSKRWLLEIEKEYDHKISKIAVSSNLWIKDDDIPYLKIFTEFNVFKSEDSLIFKSEDDYCDIYLIMTGSVVVPDCDDVTQMRIDAYDDISSMEEIETNITDIQEQAVSIENNQTGIIEPVKQNNAQNVSKEEIEDIQEYDDPMA